MKRAGIGIGAVALAGGTGLYIDDRRMIPVTVREGEILCDLHAHPANYKPLEETIGMLTSPGLVGLGHNNTTRRNLTYEGATQLLDGNVEIEEITPRQLAKVGNGYFARAQELSPQNSDKQFEILAVGFEGDYLEDGNNTTDKIKEIHDRGGIAIVVHPYIQEGGLLRYRLLNPTEERALIELYERDDSGRPDAIEAHNAQLTGWVREANKKATEFSERYEIPGTSSSDTHRRTRQVKLCGVGIKPEIINAGMGELEKVIKSGDFTKYGDYDSGPYVSAWSFGMGHFYEQMFGGKS